MGMTTTAEDILLQRRVVERYWNAVATAAAKADRLSLNNSSYDQMKANKGVGRRAAAKPTETKELAKLEQVVLKKSPSPGGPKKSTIETVRKATNECSSRLSTKQPEYERLVRTRNTNHLSSVGVPVALGGTVLDTIGDALDQISLGAGNSQSQLKACFRAFEETVVPRVKARNPRFTDGQYTQLLKESWRRSPTVLTKREKIELLGRGNKVKRTQGRRFDRDCKHAAQQYLL